MKFKVIIVFIFYLFVLSNNVFAQKELKGYGKIYPNDETKFDESFSKFYSDLITAINSRNANSILEIIYPDIQLNEYHEEQNNIKYFKIKYNLSNSGDEFWKIIKKLIELGGVREEWDSSFFFPSLARSNVYAKIFGEYIYGDKELKYFVYGSVIKENIKVFQKPNENSELIGILNFEIVKVMNFDSEIIPEWFRIKLKNDEIGYVKSENIYLAIFDYYCSFKKIEGKWYLTALEPTGL